MYRRYKEFLLLREMLFSRYPGLVIPPMPPKVFGNKAEEVISERKYFLD